MPAADPMSPSAFFPLSRVLRLRRPIVAAAVCASIVLAAPALADRVEDSLSAARLGDTSQLAKLLERGVDVNAADARGTTLLMLAARDGHLATVRVLLQRKAQLDARNQAGDSALMLAVLHDHGEVVEALLQAGAQVDQDGWTALHYAAFEGRDALFDRLLEAGADVNARAPNLSTPLMLAARNGHMGVVRRLLGNAGTELNALNEAGLSADTWAEQNGNTDIAERIRAERKRRGLPAPAMRIRIE